MDLAEKITKGDEKSAARLISHIEAEDPAAYRELTKLLPCAGHAHVIGVTGPAGAGKSTMIGELASRLLGQGEKVGIIAIDPTSVRSGGAFLGDRVRMKGAEKAGGVFIRSMADRDHPGGVCRAALGAVAVMEGLGKRFIFIESVGAGQSDKGLFDLTDTVVTVFTPEFGDEIQLLKAGLLEIGDMVVINKADKPGIDDARRAIVPHLKGTPDWQPPLLATTASSGEGMDEFLQAIRTRGEFLAHDGRGLKVRRDKIVNFMMVLLKEQLWKSLSAHLCDEAGFRRGIEEVRQGRENVYSAAEAIMSEIEARLKDSGKR